MGEQIYTIGPGEPFLERLAEAVVGGLLSPSAAPPDPLALARTTILLPTRRSARALQEAFLRVESRRRGADRSGVALVLPRIRPIAETLEDLSLVQPPGHDLAGGPRGVAGAAAAILGLPPAVTEIERRLALTRLVLAWSGAMRGQTEAGTSGDVPLASAGAETPAQALRLAAELARLMDMVETEGVALDRIATLVPDEHSAHWQHTLAFLEIAIRFWPAHLAERGLISPADRRDRALKLEALRLAAEPPGAGIIVAGVTGSIPATVEVMKAVLARADGRIVLQGVDHDLDAESWRQILPGAAGPGHPEHPQFMTLSLLDRLGLTRDDVVALPGTASHVGPRARLVSEAMRPAATTERWRQFTAEFPVETCSDALRGLSLIEAASEREEAEVVALVLREAIETPGRTAALVSPDRRLARRVAARLSGLGIEVDDSAGRPFAKTETGTLLDLAITAVDRAFAPADVLALLKHPLARLGLSARERGFATRTLELAAFRTLYLARGLGGIRKQLDKAQSDLDHRGERIPAAVRRLKAEDWARARDLVRRLEQAYAPLTALWDADASRPLKDYVTAHAAVATDLAALPPDEGESELWRGADGELGAQVLAGLAHSDLPELSLRRRDYAEVYRNLVQGETVRPSAPSHPRVSIWGPLEARLQRPDLVVLGSLNEGTWPEAADPGPWLNRPMREALGLPAPEERLGAAAHDLSMLLGADRVIMTRAVKVDNTPKVPSRWLMRLSALLASIGQRPALEPAEPWLAWARARDEVPVSRPRAEPPAPRPAYVLRPRRLSVSDVGTWIANPYAIYARRILELEALAPIGRAPDAALRGTVFHQALAEFTISCPTALPADPAAELIETVRGVIAAYTGDIRVAAFWVPRLERFCRWFAATEAARRQGASLSLGEVAGKISLAGLTEPFVLTARADRVDVTAAGLVITDYKTGTPPSAKRVASGFAPQLPLEAAIAEIAGLGTLPPGPVSRLVYIRATGGDPPGNTVVVADGDVSALAAATVRDVERLVQTYDRVEQPYRALRRPGFQYAFDDYAHLARVAEWLAADAGTDAEAADTGAADSSEKADQ